MRRDAEHVEIHHVIRFLRPQRLELRDRIVVMFRKQLAQSQQVSRLPGIRLVSHHRRQRRDRRSIFPLVVVDQSDVQPDPAHLGLQLRRFLQKTQRLVPIFAAHGDHAQVGVRGSGLRVHRKHLAKRFFRAIKVALLQRRLPFSKQSLRIQLLSSSLPVTTAGSCPVPSLGHQLPQPLDTSPITSRHAILRNLDKRSRMAI